MNQKCELRKTIKEKKSNLTKVEIEQASKTVTDQLLSSNLYNMFDKIYMYVAFNEEIQTYDIIRYSLSIGKKVAVPKVTNNVMEFYYIENFDDLKTGYYGILEPTTTKKAMDEHALMIIPGLAFDLNGNRVGYGGGFYDKYLEEHNEVKKHNLVNVQNDPISIQNGYKFLKIALAYDFQVFDTIRTDHFDYQIDQIITPSRWIKIREESL